MNITQPLRRSLQQAPDRPMTMFGDRTRTARQTHDRVARLAGALRSIGVARGDRVGILALNSDRYHEYLLAVPWAGAAVNPVNIRWSATEIAYSLRESGTRILFVDDAFAGAVSDVRALWPELGTVIYCGEQEAPDGILDYESLIAESAPVDDAGMGGDDLFGVFYTGGTTGHPKGVMLSHDNLFASAYGSLASGDFVSPAGRLLHAAPMFHLADIAAWLAGCIAGSTHVMIPQFSAEATLRAIEDHKVTDTLLVPTMLQLLVDDGAVRDYDLGSIQHLIYGASPMSGALLDRVCAVFPRARLTQAYGMTELSPIATLLLPEDHHDPVHRNSAGRAAPHSEVRIVDADGSEVPRGVVGEIAVRGDHVMRGYWNREQDTAYAVRDGWMHTGDGGRMDEDGYVFVVDRIKDMIITGGENVYSAEVENALARHPAVAACAVIGVPDPEWGERVHAVVVLLPGHEASAEELRSYCKERIAGYKAPRTVAFVAALPMSGAGKILKRELRKVSWEGAASRVP